MGSCVRSCCAASPRRRARTRRPAPSCSEPPATSWNGLAWPAWTTCRNLLRSCRRTLRASRMRTPGRNPQDPQSPQSPKGPQDFEDDDDDDFEDDDDGERDSLTDVPGGARLQKVMAE